MGNVRPVGRDTDRQGGDEATTESENLQEKGEKAPPLLQWADIPNCAITVLFWCDF